MGEATDWAGGGGWEEERGWQEIWCARALSAQRTLLVKSNIAIRADIVRHVAGVLDSGTSHTQRLTTGALEKIRRQKRKPKNYT